MLSDTIGVIMQHLHSNARHAFLLLRESAPPPSALTCWRLITSQDMHLVLHDTRPQKTASSNFSTCQRSTCRIDRTQKN